MKRYRNEVLLALGLALAVAGINTEGWRGVAMFAAAHGCSMLMRPRERSAAPTPLTGTTKPNEADPAPAPDLEGVRNA